MEQTEIVIQGSTAAIALAALTVTIWEGITNRRHNRLSLRPFLSITQHLGGTQGRFGISVDNDGLGPAAITRCSVSVDGDVISDEEDPDWNVVLSKLGLEVEAICERIRGRAIHSGDRKWLLTIRLEDASEPVRKALLGAFKRLRVEIHYDSFYGEGYVARYS
jgi:hypothetical protein